MKEEERDRYIRASQGTYSQLIGGVPKCKQSELENIAPVYAEQEINKEENGRGLILWFLAAMALFTGSGLIFIVSKVMQ